jgi:hypothetical protein
MLKKLLFVPALLSLLAAVNCGRPSIRLAENPLIRDIGIPVQSVNWVRLHNGSDAVGKPAVYATMGQTADNLFLLRIDPETGEFAQYLSKVPESNYPTATLMSRSGKLYVGAAYAGHLLCYDPSANRFDDLGALNPGKASFPCAIDEDADGTLWIGSYGTADLTSYDPRTGAFKRYGRMDEVDMYNYPMVNSDGMICNRIMMTAPHLVVLDPKTGEKKTVGPVAAKGKESFDLVRGGDNTVYISSSMGNFRIQGFTAVPVVTIPQRAAPPKSAYTSTFIDADQQLYRRLMVKKPDGSAQTFALNYKAAGTEIFVLHCGPDGCLYGSSILPEHLFRYDPYGEGRLDDMGKCSAASGEAYSMANFYGSIYISSYPGAVVSVYKPGKSYHYGSESEDNPRELGRIDDISYRPRSTVAGPLGRVWLASLPDYGRWGGPLSWYDPSTGKKHAYYRIFGDGSCYTLAHLEKLGLLAVGTTIQAGSGTTPKVDKAQLFLWDYKAEKKVWEGAPDRQVDTFNALLTAPDGRLFGTVTGGGNPELFVFDPISRTFPARKPLPEGSQLDNGIQVGPNGFLYGFTSSCFYRIDPKTLEIREIVRKENEFNIPGPIIGKDVYYAHNHVLRAIKVFR